MRAVAAAESASSAASVTRSSGWWRDAEATAEVGDPRRPVQLAPAARGERREPDDRLALRIEVPELRADVHMEPERVEPTAECVREKRDRLVGRQTELRAVVAGADRLVRVRVDAERDPHEHALDTGAAAASSASSGRVDHHRRPCPRSRSEERRALVVAVHDELVPREPGGERDGELALRGDVGADSFLAEQAEHRHVGERLRPVDEPARTDGRAQPARTRTQRLLAVHDEGCPEALDECGGRDPAELSAPPR